MEGIAGQLRKSLPSKPEASPCGKLVRICEREPLAFWSRFLGGLEKGTTIVLEDPGWPEDWGNRLGAELGDLPEFSGPRILIPTSGSTGIPRFCIHSIDTLWSSAMAFAARFKDRGILHSLNVLPQHHVGGLMPVLRSAACGGLVHFCDYRDPETFHGAAFPLRQASISLVPTQLRRMMEDAQLREILLEAGMILVGGSVCPEDLLMAARAAGLRLAPCYGSTETAAMVTLLEPDNFLAGVPGVGGPLGHARVEIGPDGRVLIEGESNLLGYWPPQEGFCRTPLTTSDLGRIDTAGRLVILGRADRIIITGGEKVHPEQVEKAAMESGMVSDAWCSGTPHPDWGQLVRLAVVPAGDSYSRDRLVGVLRKRLPAYALPKVVEEVRQLPRTELGKLRQPGGLD